MKHFHASPSGNSHPLNIGPVLVHIWTYNDWISVIKVFLFNGLAAIECLFSVFQWGWGVGHGGCLRYTYIYSYTHGVFRTYVHFYTVNYQTYTRNAQHVVRITV